MEANMPVYAQKWEEEDDIRVDHADHGPTGFTGLMYRGKWLISPERQEKTVRIFWVSEYFPGISMEEFLAEADGYHRDYCSRTPSYLWASA